MLTEDKMSVEIGSSDGDLVEHKHFIVSKTYEILSVLIMETSIRYSKTRTKYVLIKLWNFIKLKIFKNYHRNVYSKTLLMPLRANFNSI